MKRIIFVGQSLRIGGAQRALINQLNDLDKREYEVSLFLYSCTGEYLNLLDPRVNLVKSNFLLSCMGKTQTEAKKKLLWFVVRTIMALLVRIFGSDIIYTLVFRASRKLSGYDVAISYLHNTDNHSLYYGYNKFVLNNIKASKKIAWIHSDYKEAKLNNDENRKEYEEMDYVVNVSQEMKKEFDLLTGMKDEKSKFIYNILPAQDIIQLSSQYQWKGYDNAFTMVTICRMDSNKSIYQLCKIAEGLLHKGLHFHWHFLGEGQLYQAAKEWTQRRRLEESIIFHGYVSNPYPILKGADLLVSGSKSETFGMSIAESLILRTPVVALKYPALKEIIRDGNGIAVSSFHEMSLAIEELIEEPGWYRCLRRNTGLNYDYNEQSRKTFSRMIIEECSGEARRKKEAEVLVTVVIPTYKRPEHLSRALYSVLNQSHHNLEIIVVDDNDHGDPYRIETEAFMESFIDQRIQYVKHDCNKGGSAARNTGIGLAKGKYITFLDDDDEYEVHKIKEQVKSMENLRDDWVACYTQSTRYRDGMFVDKTKECRSGDLYLPCFRNEIYLNAGSNLFVRSEVAREIGGFDESFRRMQDLEFLIRVAETGRIACINQYLLKVHLHGAQLPVDYKKQLAYIQHFFDRFNRRLMALPKRERKKIYQSKYLDLLKVAFKDKDYPRIWYLLRRKKIGVDLLMHYIIYLAKRKCTKKVYGFRI